MMSTSNTQKSQESQDMYSTYQQNMNRFWGDIEKSMSQYQQSISNLQNECEQSCRKMAESVISLQQEFANRAGMNQSIPEANRKTVNDMMNAVNKAYAIQNQTTLTTIDVTRQNIKALNENIKSFADLNQNILQSCMSAWSPRQE